VQTESIDSVTAWVLTAMKYELDIAGYKVLADNDAAAVESDIQLSVDIQEVFGKSGVANGAKVLLQGTLENIGRPMVINQFEGRAKLYTGTAKSVANSLSLALQDAILKMLANFELTPPQ
jgi:hypothetical protein